MKDLKNTHGGARPGSGVKKGQKFAKTVSKEQARELARQIITEHLRTILSAELDNAKGIKHLMYRDPTTGKFERVSGTEDQIDAALKMGNAFWIYTKDPNVQACMDLLNRAIDKPAEHVQLTGKDNEPITFKWQS